VVADWPIAWREQWGRRANELEETGLSWRDAETQAFVELWHKIRHETGASASSPGADPVAPAVVEPPSTVETISSVDE
jgi:hypothetical protein